MSWLATNFPFAGILSSSGLASQTGLVAFVPADGSASIPVTFATPFLTTISSVTLTPSSTGIYELSAQVVPGTALVTGFSLIVTGGAPGSFVSVYYNATGA